MKLISEYLSTKIKKINNKDYSDFPEKNKLIDVIEFLNHYEYEEIEFPNDVKDMDELISFFNKKIENTGNPIYCTIKHDFYNLYCIHCCKNKITEQNPLFIIYCTDDGNLPKGWSRYGDKYVNSEYYNKLRDKVIYKDEVKKYFGLE